jgi:hypothetical protein
MFIIGSLVARERKKRERVEGERRKRDHTSFALT